MQETFEQKLELDIHCMANGTQETLYPGYIVKKYYRTYDLIVLHDRKRRAKHYPNLKLGEVVKTIVKYENASLRNLIVNI